MRRRIRALWSAVAAATARTAEAQLPNARLETVAPTAAENPWAGLVEADLRAAAGAVLRIYPAAVDSTNPGWRRLFDEAVERAQRQAREVTSFAGYAAVLKRFRASFADEHLDLRLTLAPESVEWAGFLPGLRNGAYVVLASDLPDVRVGDEVTECDGVPVDTWVREHVVPFEGGVPSLEADRGMYAPWLLVDQGNPFVPRPKACTVGGRTVTLAWRPTPYTGLRDCIPGLVLGSYLPEYAARPFGTNGVWIQMPRFLPQTLADVERFQCIVDSAATFRGRDIVVLDVRRNGGGNSSWFMSLLRNLYGQDVVRYYAREAAGLTRAYRVSPEIVDHYVGSLAPGVVRQFGASSPQAASMNEVVEQLRAALARGERTYAEPTRRPEEPARPAAPPPNPVKGRVYVITDYRCGSACLSFLDEVLSFPNVTHVGWPTHADHPYSQPLSYPLPSGLASMRIATMIRGNRTRATNQPFIPKVRFDGDIGDTAALERWILELDRRHAQ